MNNEIIKGGKKEIERALEFLARAINIMANESARLETIEFRHNDNTCSSDLYNISIDTEDLAQKLNILYGIE